MADRAVLGAGALVAMGLILGGTMIGRGIADVRKGDRVVTVRGLAERDVTADLATWTIATQATGSDLASLQAKAAQDAATVRAFLGQYGFGPAEVQTRGLSVNQYLDQARVLNITVRQRFQLRTPRVADAARAYQAQAELLRRGVALDADAGGGIVYSFTRLNAVKPAMIAEATRNARAGAEQFAKDSGASVGGIRTAAQGLFTITARDGEDGGAGRDSPQQKVRVVSTIDFYLED